MHKQNQTHINHSLSTAWAKWSSAIKPTSTEYFERTPDRRTGRLTGLRGLRGRSSIKLPSTECLDRRAERVQSDFEDGGTGRTLDFKQTMASGSGGENFVFKGDGQKLFVLGDRKAFLTVQKWRGMIHVHIRNHMVPGDVDENGVLITDYIPTKRGVALNYAEFQRLCGMQDLVHKLVGELSVDSGKQRPSGRGGSKSVKRKRAAPLPMLREEDTIILGDEDEEGGLVVRHHKTVKN